MEKKVIEIKLEYGLDWAYEVVLISKIKEDLADIERLGATHVSIDCSMRYDDPFLEVFPICKRIETDQEAMDRLNDEQLKATALEIKELAEFERLKQKYQQ